MGRSEMKDREVVPVRVKLGYGAGDFAMSMAFNLPAFYLMYYFTDVFGIAAAAAGMIMFSSKIWDSLVSPAMGYISDHTKSRWGSKRPYILFGSVPLFIAMIIMFTNPQIEGQTLLFVWGTATYCFLCLTYTLINIPYNSLTP